MKLFKFEFETDLDTMDAMLNAIGYAMNQKAFYEEEIPDSPEAVRENLQHQFAANLKSTWNGKKFVK